MITSFSIHNFKCFKQVEVKELRRVNLIVGGNSSGKTTLMEALVMAGTTSPGIYFQLQQLRGAVSGSIIPFRRLYEALFADIFYNFDSSKTASINFCDSLYGQRGLHISYQQDTATRMVSLPLSSPQYETTAITPIHFVYEVNGKQHDLEVEAAKDGLKVKALNNVVPTAFLSATTMPDSQDTAERYSVLNRKHQTAPLLAALQTVFPQVEDLSLEIENGSQAALYAGIRSLPERLPIGSLSSGINRYLSMLVAVASLSKGIVLIDEMENGLYYEMQESIVRSLVRLCREVDAQLFVSTHSLEMMRAIARAMDGAEHDLCLLRMEREADYSTIERFDGLDFESALEQRVEVR